MTTWLRWDERPQGGDERRIPYMAGDCFLLTTVHDGDSFSENAEAHFGFSFEPDVVDVSQVIVSLVVLGTPLDEIASSVNLSQREVIRLMQDSGLSPPVPDAPFVGTPIYIGDADTTQMANQFGWSVFFPFDGWLFQQEGTDRFWVLGDGTYDAADTTHWSASSGGAGGASVPGAGEHIFVDNGSDVLGDNFAITVAANTAALGNISINCTDATGTLALVTYTCSCAAFTCTAGITTVTTGTYTLSSNLLINGGTFGSNSAHTLTVGGTYVRSSGIHNAPNATGTFNMNGATYTGSAGTLNTNLGKITFNGGVAVTVSEASSFYNIATATALTAVTQGSAITAASNMVPVAGTSWNTSAASSYSLTVSLTVQFGATISCNNSTVSIGVTYTGNACLYCNGGIFNGGTGAHSFGNMFLVGGTVTLTSGTTTLPTARAGGGYVINFASVTTLNHGGGTISFTFAGLQDLRHINNTEQTLNNVILNKASGNVQFFNALGFKLTVAGALTITSGTFDTSETVSGTSRDLTVSGASSVTGTLTGNNSAVSLQALTINLGGVVTTARRLSVLGVKSGTGVEVLAGSSGLYFTVNNGLVNNGSFTHAPTPMAGGTAKQMLMLLVEG